MYNGKHNVLKNFLNKLLLSKKKMLRRVLYVPLVIVSALNEGILDTNPSVNNILIYIHHRVATHNFCCYITQRFNECFSLVLTDI